MKSGLEYFPLDTILDDKFALIEAEYGLQGFAVIIKLYQRIYGTEGYYCCWNEEVALLFSRACGLGCSAVSEIVSAAVRRGIFDNTMYQDYGILTSEGIQKRYLQCAKRREKVVINKQYLLGNYAQDSKNVYINEENVYRNSKNAYRNSQSKVKESKVKESKESKRHAHGEYKNVYLTDEDYQKWTSECALAEKYIEDMSSYLARTGKSYKNYLAALRKWYSEDKSKAPQTASYDLKEAERKSIERRPVYRGKQNG